jgi:GntR family transcriptional regulator
MKPTNAAETLAAPGFRPLYMQVQDLMVQKLASGEWRPGEMLPTEPKLADFFKVSQGTVRKALDRLESLNLVVRRQGKGTYVSTHTPQRELFHFFHLVGDDGSRQLPESRVFACRTRRANRQEAENLNLDDKAKVIVIERLRSLDGTPTIVETIVVPEALFPGLGEEISRDAERTLYEHFEKRYGVTILNATERLHAAPLGREDAELLGIPQGEPILVIDRLAFSHRKLPVEWRISRCGTLHHYYLSEIE